MLIQKMSPEECLETLARAGFGRLACARENQPYVVPVYFVYDRQHHGGGEDQSLYLFSAPGQKIEWMRANPLVCLETDEVKDWNEWVSVVVMGRYEELPDAPEFRQRREHAHELLQKRAMWWQPAYASVSHRGQPRALPPVFYCINIDRVTGHRASPDETEAVSASTEKAVKGRGWLNHLLHPKHKG